MSNGESPANLSNWDTHDDNFPRLREQLPRFDWALSALVTDLHERGLQNDVVVVACGEMGRALGLACQTQAATPPHPDAITGQPVSALSQAAA